jgi:hypothetical protein
MDSLPSARKFVTLYLDAAALTSPLSQRPLGLTRNALVEMTGLAGGETTFCPRDVRVYQCLFGFQFCKYCGSSLQLIELVGHPGKICRCPPNLPIQHLLGILLSI